eukprot:TRINITY_DN51967_c0_g1_i1.p1 TRINITY_DN51967_c0_g1~~TRINITY_DN51967_c0_g1_i1.p1  ORF type:complete len:272 (+),score=79.29 TRINITY_DN51967_c0_g1_i1:82-816(+)
MAAGAAPLRSRRPVNRVLELIGTAAGGAPRAEREQWLLRNVLYYPGLLSDLRLTTDALCRELNFARCWLDTGMEFGRPMRLGTPAALAASPGFSAVLDSLQRRVAVEVLRASANLYRNGDDWCNFHSDQLRRGVAADAVLLATFGHPRPLVMRPRQQPEAVGDWAPAFRFPCEDGDVVGYTAAANRLWSHGVPRAPADTPARISIQAHCRLLHPGADPPALRLQAHTHMSHTPPRGTASRAAAA